MKTFLKLTLFSLLLAGTQSYASLLNDQNTAERVGFFVRGLQICHQGEWRNMTISLEYESDVNENLLGVKRFVRSFLENYDNTTDYWEIMNTKLVRALFKEFAGINTIKSKLSLAPDKTLFFPRESTVEYTRGDPVMKEMFMFTKLKYLICNVTFQALDLQVAFRFKDNPTAADYPDYRSVDAVMDEFFAENPISYSTWRTLKPKLEARLLEKFPSFATIEVEVRISKE